MKVQLFGTHPRTIKVNSNTKATASDKKSTEGEKRHSRNINPAATQHRRASFACLQKLTPRITHKVSQRDVWDYIKDRYDVTSRSNFSVQQWARISAEFNAADRNPSLLKSLIHEAWQHRENNRRTLNEPILS